MRTPGYVLCVLTLILFHLSNQDSLICPKVSKIKRFHSIFKETTPTLFNSQTWKLFPDQVHHMYDIVIFHNEFHFVPSKSVLQVHRCTHHSMADNIHVTELLNTPYYLNIEFYTPEIKTSLHTTEILLQ